MRSKASRIFSNGQLVQFHKKIILYNLVCGADGFRAFCLNRLFAQVSRGTVNAMASPEVVT